MPVDDSSANASDFDLPRLQKAVRALLSEGQRLRAENAALRGDLDASVARVKELDTQVGALEERRGEARERLEGLISRVDAIASLSARVEN